MDSSCGLLYYCSSSNYCLHWCTVSFRTQYYVLICAHVESAFALRVGGGGVGCKAPKIRPMLSVLRMGLVFDRVSYEPACTALQSWLVLWYYGIMVPPLRCYGFIAGIIWKALSPGCLLSISSRRSEDFRLGKQTTMTTAVAFRGALREVDQI